MRTAPAFRMASLYRRNVSPALDFHDILLMPGQKRALERLSEPRLRNTRSNGVKNHVWPSNGRFASDRPQGPGAGVWRGARNRADNPVEYSSECVSHHGVRSTDSAQAASQLPFASTMKTSRPSWTTVDEDARRSIFRYMPGYASGRKSRRQSKRRISCSFPFALRSAAGDVQDVSRHIEIGTCIIDVK